MTDNSSCWPCVPPHTVLGQGPIWIKEEQTFVTTEYLQRMHVQFLTILRNNQYYYCFTHITFLHIILTKTWKILPYWYHNICMFIVAYLTVLLFKEILVSAPRRWRNNSAEPCTRYVGISYVKDYTHKIWNRALVGVTWVIYFFFPVSCGPG